MERIPDILQRLAALETSVENSEKLLRSSVDDIKATIRSEVADLKGEQIADLKNDAKAISRRLKQVEDEQARWSTARGLVNWMIRAAIAAGGLAVGIFGSKHLGVGG